MHNDAIGQARWTARSTWATSRASGQKFLIESGKEGDVTELMTPVLALLRLVDDEAIAAASMGRLRHETQPGDTGSPCHSARGLSLRLEVVHELNRCALARPA